MAGKEGAVQVLSDGGVIGGIWSWGAYGAGEGRMEPSGAG